MLALLPLLILLCFGYPTQIGVLGGPVITTRPGASDQNPPLYMIFFKDGATKTEKEDYAKALEKAVSAERMGSIPLDEQNFILGALLTDSQLTAWNKSPVKKIERDTSTVEQDDSDLQSQLQTRELYRHQLPVNENNPSGDRWPEMIFLSQPPAGKDQGLPLDSLADFAFEDEAGSGATVYIHDSGIRIDHDEFTQNPDGILVGTISVLDSKKSVFGKLFDYMASGDIDGHGTCMDSKVVGNKYGSAKSANLKMVPMANGWSDIGFAVPDVLIGLNTIIEDIEKVRRESSKKAFFPIVNFSYSIGVDEEAQKEELKSWREKIKQLLDMDATIVAASGNRGYDHPDVYRYPALFAKEFPEIIVVGAVDPEGRAPRWMNGGKLVKVWAPGTRYTLGRLKQVATQGLTAATGRELQRKILLQIECAAPQAKDATAYRDGTSIAAATVSGLIAYAMSIDSSILVEGEVQRRALDWLLKRSYPRAPGRKSAVYNGAVPDFWCPA